jgi:hypothetical protein
MTYGIRVENDSGFTQIDDSTQGFQVLATGTVAASNAYTINAVSIPSSYPDDILVVAKPNNPNTSTTYELYAMFEDFLTYNTGTRYRYAYLNFAVGGTYVATEPVDYAIIQRCSEFDDSLISGQTPPNQGLSIYQSDGTLSFTSEHPTYRVQAARHQNISASNSGAGTWYNGVSAGDIENIYGLAMGYGGYKYRTFGPAADREYESSSRVLKWDFPNNSISTAIRTIGGQAGYTPIRTKVWEGHRTEILGYIV